MDQKEHLIWDSTRIRLWSSVGRTQKRGISAAGGGHGTKSRDGGQGRFLEWDTFVPCAKVRKRRFMRRGQTLLAMNPWGMFQLICESHQGCQESSDSFLSPCLLAQTGTERSFSLFCTSESPPLSVPGTREENWVAQDSFPGVECIIRLWPVRCSLVDCFVVEFPIFPRVRLYVMFLTWNADSEREDSKTTILMLLGPIKAAKVKTVPVGSDATLKSVDAALWIRISAQQINT